MTVRARHCVLLLGLLTPPAVATDATLRIEVINEAGVPADTLAATVRDFRDWARRVHAYHGVREPHPVTLRLTREVAFGFYRDGVVILPPNDRWTMLDDWVHEFTHHVTGQDSGFFFKEGIAVHTLEELFRREGRIPATWPQFGRPTDAWVALFAERGVLPPLREAQEWPRYRGDTPEHDFRSWQIYLIGGSFTGWYIRRHGMAEFQAAFRRRSFDALPALERAWFADIATAAPGAFDPAAVLPSTPRYRAYAERLRVTPAAPARGDR